MFEQMRILVVEGAEKHTAELERVGQDRALAVDTVHEAFAARVYATDQDYTIIILDLTFFACDGPGLCRQLRQDGVDSPILLISAPGTIDILVRALGAGGTDYLLTPFSVEELSARLQMHARSRAHSRV